MALTIEQAHGHAARTTTRRSTQQLTSTHGRTDLQPRASDDAALSPKLEVDETNEPYKGARYKKRRAGEPRLPGAPRTCNYPKMRLPREKRLQTAPAMAILHNPSSGQVLHQADHMDFGHMGVPRVSLSIDEKVRNKQSSEQFEFQRAREIGGSGQSHPSKVTKRRKREEEAEDETLGTPARKRERGLFDLPILKPLVYPQPVVKPYHLVPLSEHDIIAPHINQHARQPAWTSYCSTTPSPLHSPHLIQLGSRAFPRLSPTPWQHAQPYMEYPQPDMQPDMYSYERRNTPNGYSDRQLNEQLNENTRRNTPMQSSRGFTSIDMVFVSEEDSESRIRRGAMLDEERRDRSNRACYYCRNMYELGAFGKDQPEKAIVYPGGEKFGVYNEKNGIPAGCSLYSPHNFCMPCGASRGFYQPGFIAYSQNPTSFPADWGRPETPSYWVCNCPDIHAVPVEGVHVGEENCPTCKRDRPFRSCE